MTCPEHPHNQLSGAACVGRRGGQAKSQRTQQAARVNGQKAGRPKRRAS
jgi:hypothetical protein